MCRSRKRTASTESEVDALKEEKKKKVSEVLAEAEDMVVKLKHVRVIMTAVEDAEKLFRDRGRGR